MSEEREFYEPWVPEVGDKVRLRFSPECRCLVCGGPGHSEDSEDFLGKRLLGTVRYIYPRGYRSSPGCGHSGNNGHRFSVTAEDADWTYSGLVAACEMEKVKEAP